jgi:hypothetical protein
LLEQQTPGSVSLRCATWLTTDLTINPPGVWGIDNL